jgi:hypothetical protein
MVVQNSVVIPQGLKPHLIAVFFGPAKQLAEKGQIVKAASRRG